MSVVTIAAIEQARGVLKLKCIGELAFIVPDHAQRFQNVLRYPKAFSIADAKRVGDVLYNIGLRVGVTPTGDEIPPHIADLQRVARYINFSGVSAMVYGKGNKKAHLRILAWLRSNRELPADDAIAIAKALASIGVVIEHR